MKNKLTYVYLLFWLSPLLTSPFLWFGATVEDIGIFRPIRGNGILVAKNFSTLAIFYFLLTLAMVLFEYTRRSRFVKIVILSLQIVFLSFFFMIPRIILGPTGLSPSGLSDVDFYRETYWISVQPAYVIALLGLVLSVSFYFIFNFLKEKN
ncbi:hypothetical protein NRIC_00680 [Enterococcus florum]|uniref:Uncharacterized protein n=1 Tax=Enterococcus florum TaxID=2480627 RepID=A0A4P5P376_9ENTE|nr:hypothetical protein [Enterococcus florum]GCF92177.1 hypothetical protein NRIC_00680 [Enterococcus florum]